jgi:hypothetical protein
LIITLGSEKYRAAPLTSPRRNASDHALITDTAAGRAAIPVGPGVGTTESPAGSWGSGGNGTERAGASWAWRAVVLPKTVVDPHPARHPATTTAVKEAQCARAITRQS